MAVSVLSGEGLDRLTEALRGRVTVVAGPSGAGKSSIINALRLRSLGLESALGALDTAGAGAEAGGEEEEEEEGGAAGGVNGCGQAPGEAAAADGSPQQRLQDGAAPPPAGPQHAEQRDSSSSSAAGLQERHQQRGEGGGSAGAGALLAGLDLQAVGSVSQRIGRGRHTTRNVTLLELEGSGGGLVVDTPGFNQPTLGMPAGELAQHFPEIRRLLEQDRWVGAVAICSGGAGPPGQEAGGRGRGGGRVCSQSGRQAQLARGPVPGLRCRRARAIARARRPPAPPRTLPPSPCCAHPAPTPGPRLGAPVGAPSAAASTWRSRAVWCGGRGGSGTLYTPSCTVSSRRWRRWRRSGRPGRRAPRVLAGWGCQAAGRAAAATTTAHLGAPAGVLPAAALRAHLLPCSPPATLKPLFQRKHHRTSRLPRSKKRREGSVRVKSRAGGQQGVEARLETKSHRRVSRRSVKQKLSELVRAVEEDDAF